MKLTIDTQLKEISLHEDVNAEELYAMLENFLPNGLWKEFKINPNVISNWTNPIVIPYDPIYPYNPNPFPIQPSWPLMQPSPNYPWITHYCQNTTTDGEVLTLSSLNAGIYHVEFEK